MTDDVYQLTVHFSGRVQGVGFRYQTLQVAKGFEVTGFVQNLPDGRVRLRAEGEEAEVEAFVREVEEELGSCIRRTERESGRHKQQFFNFTIR